METHELLAKANELGASDLILKVGSPPLFKVHGDIAPFGTASLTPDQTMSYASQILSPAQWDQFEKECGLDLAYVLPDVCRFRGNVFMQRGSVAMVFRRIPEQVKSCDDLHLPEILKDFALRPRGLVLVTGPAGSGKSTTQAAMVDFRNENEDCHIITIEDPIEFLHMDKKALVNQRQVGTDTCSFNRALKSVLRQDPDVILVGEMRDLETIALTITAAETGHLALGTLHTNDAAQTIDRIIDAFPVHQQQQIRMQLSVNLIGVVSQMLLKRADGKGRVAAFEIMVGTSAVRNLIREGKTYQLPQVMQTGTNQGMLPMNKSILSLVKSKQVNPEEAIAKSPHPSELKQLLAS